MVDSPYLERLARRTDLPVEAATTLCLWAIEHGLERYSRYYVTLGSSLAIQLLPRTYFGPGQDEFAERILGADVIAQFRQIARIHFLWCDVAVRNGETGQAKHGRSHDCFE